MFVCTCVKELTHKCVSQRCASGIFFYCSRVFSDRLSVNLELIVDSYRLSGQRSPRAVWSSPSLCVPLGLVFSMGAGDLNWVFILVH